MNIIKWTIVCAVIILTMFVERETYCQGVVPMVNGGNVAIINSLPAVPYYQPLIATGYYAIPITTYQYLPYQYVVGGMVTYPGNWTIVNSQPVIVDRGGCFARRRYFQHYGSYYYYR